MIHRANDVSFLTHTHTLSLTALQQGCHIMWGYQMIHVTIISRYPEITSGSEQG